MDNFQIERIFATLADMDRRFIGRLDYLSDRMGTLSSEVASLSSWRDSLNKSLAEQFEKSNITDQRLRSVEDMKVHLERLKTMDERQEKMDGRVDKLEKNSIRILTVWSVFMGLVGVGMPILMHYMFKIG